MFMGQDDNMSLISEAVFASVVLIPVQTWINVEDSIRHHGKLDKSKKLRQ